MLSRNSISEVKLLEKVRLPGLKVFSLFSNRLATPDNKLDDFTAFLTVLKEATPNLTHLNISGNPLVDAQIDSEIETQNLLETEESLLLTTLAIKYRTTVHARFS